MRMSSVATTQKRCNQPAGQVSEACRCLFYLQKCSRCSFGLCCHRAYSATQIAFSTIEPCSTVQVALFAFSATSRLPLFRLFLLFREPRACPPAQVALSATSSESIV